MSAQSTRVLWVTQLLHIVLAGLLLANAWMFHQRLTLLQEAVHQHTLAIDATNRALIRLAQQRIVQQQASRQLGLH